MGLLHAAAADLYLTAASRSAPVGTKEALRKKVLPLQCFRSWVGRISAHISVKGWSKAMLLDITQPQPTGKTILPGHGDVHISRQSPQRRLTLEFASCRLSRSWAASRPSSSRTRTSTRPCARGACASARLCTCTRCEAASCSKLKCCITSTCAKPASRTARWLLPPCCSGSLGPAHVPTKLQAELALLQTDCVGTERKYNLMRLHRKRWCSSGDSEEWEDYKAVVS
jgi:hypothetical protein